MHKPPRRARRGTHGVLELVLPYYTVPASRPPSSGSVAPVTNDAWGRQMFFDAMLRLAEGANRG